MSVKAQGESGYQQHHAGEHWSGTNPIPTVQKFIQHLDRDKHERDRRIDEENKSKKKDDKRSKETDEKQEDQSQKTPKTKAKDRKVTDPTTGREIMVEDMDRSSLERAKHPSLTVPNANLGQPTNVKTDSDQDFSQYKENQDVTAPPDPVAEGTTSDVPIHGESTNILFHPTPTVHYRPMYDEMEKRATGLCIGIALAIVILGNVFGASMWGLVPLAICISCGVFLWMRDVVEKGRQMEWHSEKLRGQTATANLLPESVEWMNSFLRNAWRLVNPDMLTPVSDTIEDIMQASSPGVVENIRVAEIDQGDNPLRILSMRSLPDDQVQTLRENIHNENLKHKDPQERAVAEEGGNYYNMEASFAYHAKPSSQSTSSKARNMHMQLVFYLGIRGLLGVPFPVFVELIEMVGTVRLRCQMMPDPPFLKDATFSLVGIPHVRAGCMPMIRRGVNILNLPIISNFVNYAIKTACSIFSAPKSMTIDLSMLLKGDDIAKETQTLGIMWVRIHRAVGLSKQDRRGSQGGGSDPYINLSFSKYGKPMYCTRVITDDLNPVWEESTALLVTPELIKADEKLSVELWDSDRNTADDIVGKVELSIREMLRHPSRMYPQVSKLQGMDQGTEMPGELHWEVGYFGKPKLRPELRTDGKDPSLPKIYRNDPNFQDEKGVISNEEEDAITHTPPDPLWPSGILHVIIHQIVNLQLANIKGSKGNRKGKEYEPAKEYGENKEEQSEKLPTSYCNITLNDQLIYRTRPKSVSSQPIFNAGTERFVRDWKSAIVICTVRDQRYREHDPLLGVIPLKLSDVLQTSSQLTRWYPLDGGIGFGRVRISLLFRHVETKLPPSMLGWDVGTFEFVSDKITAEGFPHHSKIKIRSSGNHSKVNRYVSHVHGNDTVYDISNEQYRKDIRIPIKFRHRSPAVFEFHIPGKHGAAAYSTLWLQHLVDNETTPVDVPIWTTKNGARLTQNYVTERNWKAKEVPGLEDLTEVGRLKFQCRFSPGIDYSHERTIVDNDSRETYETWEACISEGVRGKDVKADIPPGTRELHEKSLEEARKMLKSSDPTERERWIDQHGQDWSGAFGDDPRAYTDSKARKVAEPGRDKPRHDPVTPPPINGQPSRERDPEKADSRLSDSEGEESGESSGAEQRSLAETGNGKGNDKGKGKDKGNDKGDDNNNNGNNNNNNNTSNSHDNGHNDNDTDNNHNEPNSNNSFNKSDNDREIEAEDMNKASSKEINRVNKNTEKRQERGIMQWKPARNTTFAKDEGKFALRKLKKKLPGGDLTGREPDIETETGRR